MTWLFWVFKDMSFSFTEKKRIRKDFGKQKPALDVPDLLTLQVNSYERFLQKDVDPEKKRKRWITGNLQQLISDREFLKKCSIRVC